MMHEGSYIAVLLIVLKIMLYGKVLKLIDNNKNNTYNRSIKNKERQNRYFCRRCKKYVYTGIVELAQSSKALNGR